MSVGVSSVNSFLAKDTLVLKKIDCALGARDVQVDVEVYAAKVQQQQHDHATAHGLGHCLVHGVRKHTVDAHVFVETQEHGEASNEVQSVEGRALDENVLQALVKSDA